MQTMKGVEHRRAERRAEEEEPREEVIIRYGNGNLSHAIIHDFSTTR